MHIFRSKSFFFLVLSGFSIVSLPLIVVLISSDLLMGKLASHSSYSVYRSVTENKLSQQLEERLENEERRARQYAILGDKHFLDEVRNIHANIQTILDSLKPLSYNASPNNPRLLFIDLEAQLFNKLINSPPKSTEYEEALTLFTELNILFQKISLLINTRTFEEIASIEQETTKAKRILFWQALTLIPLTILLIIYFTRLISNPIQKITKGINSLGQGDFSTPISVKGPEDLVFLGDKLNWLREKLAFFEKEKNKFSAHVSHELKTPLASIREASELLADEVAGPINKQQKEIVTILKKSSLQLQELIENLLGYTMAQAQKHHLSISEFSLESLLDKIITSYKPALLKKDITIDISVSDIILRGDIECIRVMIDNLLSNALKYSPHSGRISLIATQHEQMINVDVIDSGPGVPEAESEKIFQPFFQGSITSHSSIKGTGLGLAIVREYASAHGGTIHLLSNKTKGAHFKLTLPLSAVKNDQ